MFFLTLYGKQGRHHVMIALSDYDLPVYTERIKRNTDTESYPLCSVSTGLF